jgi:anaphase-promoting complex subunit 1
MLLNRMQNVNLSSSDTDADTDFWIIRSAEKENTDTTAGQAFLNECHIDSEEELYVKGNTAVWTKGIISNEHVLPQTSLTCETPIKFALFCSKKFIESAEKYDAKEQQEKQAVCLIDETCLKVYWSNGETFMTTVEGQVSFSIFCKVPTN